jgi:hypothetical protein
MISGLNVNYIELGKTCWEFEDLAEQEQQVSKLFCCLKINITPEQ